MPELDSIKEEESFLQNQPSEVTRVTEQPLTSLLVSPLSSPINGINDIEDSSKRKDKIAIPQNKPPVCIAQSLPGIIIVPSLPQIAADLKQSTNIPKYKRIQPKPLHGEVFRSRAGSVGSSVSSKSNIRSADGRRSSHAWLQSDNLVESDEKLVRNSTPFKSVQEKRNTLKDNIRFETPHNSKSILENNVSDSLLEKRKKTTELQRPKLIVQSSIQVNNFDVEDNNCFKRHLDENDEHTNNKRFHLDLSKLSNDSAWIPKTVDVNNTLNAQASKKFIGIGHEEVNVHEIEGDALNDYFRGANHHNASNSQQQNDLEQQISSNNKVKQLSQLRMLLEQNLPSAISKMSPTSIKVQKVSKIADANENVLSTLSLDPKKPFLPVLQDAQRTLLSNVVFENPGTQSVVISSSNGLKDDPQIDNLDKLLSSNYLTSDAETNMDSQLLSDPNVFLNCSQNSIQEMDVSLHSELNQNSSVSDILLSSTLMSDAELVDEQINATIRHGKINTCTQVPSVPQSPNTRRRAFNFMPISPRHTPIPDGVSMNETSSVASPHLRTMISTAVGPSQPPSNSGSPFVSPRSTPVPLCRSRHSSGQSTYSTSRHTPFQNFDSGVSSVSSSPFISPQPTPIPVSRLRHNSNHGSSKTVTFSSINSPQVIYAHSALNNMPQLRIRHSSGPGGAHAPATSLSPVITEVTAAQSFVFPSSTEVRSRHNSGSNTTTPLSPVSEQASSSSSCASNMPDLSGVNDVGLSSSHSFLNDGAGDILISANPSSFKQVRHRHVSGSVIYGKSSYSQRDIFSQEIQKLLKNNQDNASSDLILSNRSQSVPLHQMLQTADGFCFLAQPFEESCPKSHPSTPVMNQIFSFPSVGTNQETPSLSLGMDIANRDKSALQNSQMEWTGFENSTDMEPSSARRNLTTLYDAAPLSDDLQTTLEDLRDCDTVFSKLELELRQSEESVL